MKQVMKRIYAGATCDVMIYNAPELREGGYGKPRPRFKTEAERAEHRRQIARRHCARLINENITANGMYCTLTFDREHEIHTVEEARRERTNFRRRLQRKYPDAVIFLFFGRGGSNTQRIHFHMICEGLPAEYIRQCWTGGAVDRIEFIRENCRDAKGKDIGADYTGLANYCFDHWTPEQGEGHYYSRTNNVRQPEEEEPEECAEDYSTGLVPEGPEGYDLIEARRTPYGMYWFHYVRRKRQDQYSLLL